MKNQRFEFIPVLARVKGISFNDDNYANLYKHIKDVPKTYRAIKIRDNLGNGVVIGYILLCGNPDFFEYNFSFSDIIDIHDGKVFFNIETVDNPKLFDEDVLEPDEYMVLDSWTKDPDFAELNKDLIVSEVCMNFAKMLDLKINNSFSNNKDTAQLNEIIDPEIEIIESNFVTKDDLIKLIDNIYENNPNLFISLVDIIKRAQ